MPDFNSKLEGTVNLSLKDYHKLLQAAQAKSTNEEKYKRRKAQIETAAKEVEQFLSFLFKESSIELEDYIEAYNRSATNSTLKIDNKKRKILVDLKGVDDE